VLGTLIALYAERGNRRLAKPLNVLALLPIITPPFVVGLGLILLFGRAGLVNQLLEWAFGIPPTRWFYGLFGRVAGADVRLHADRLHDHARRGAGHQPQHGRSGADAARQPLADLHAR
jgi:hypothetical protein